MLILYAIAGSLAICYMKISFSIYIAQDHISTGINTQTLSRYQSILQKDNSLSILMAEVQNVKRPIPDEKIIPFIEETRCEKFGPLAYGGRTRRRRIFAGSLLADDSWHSLGSSALESYGIYHSITFVESNRTQSYEPRSLRFVPGSDDLRIIQSGIFGPNVPVYIENFDDPEKRPSMLREHMMREVILKKWKELGMTRDDIGLIMDIDEIVSRDFLRAAQICEIPDERWSTAVTQTCRSPLLKIFVPTFEGSPKCVHKGLGGNLKRFAHPDMVIGACIEGIGDSSRHPPAPRGYLDKNGRPQGARQKGYGEAFDYHKIPNGRDGYFPLYNAADFRRMKTDLSVFGATGYHMHNFFVLANKLRFKHAYYGHKHEHAFTAPLGAMNADINLLVKCVHNISDEGNKKQRIVNGLEVFLELFPLPASFLLEGYIDARHEEMKALVKKDEEEYGRADMFDGNHLYKEHMLTHPGRRQNDTNDRKKKR